MDGNYDAFLYPKGVRTRETRTPSGEEIRDRIVGGVTVESTLTTPSGQQTTWLGQDPVPSSYPKAKPTRPATIKLGPFSRFVAGMFGVKTHG